MTRRTANVELLKDDYLMIHPEDAARHVINEGDMFASSVHEVKLM
jgi:formate dehydrogenase major subunit